MARRTTRVALVPPDGTVLMGRPSIGFHMEAGTTHRQLHANPLIKFKELRDVPAI